MGKAKRQARAELERNRRLIEAGVKPPAERVWLEARRLPGSFESGKRR